LKANPQRLEFVREQYAAAFASHGNSAAAVLCPKGRQHTRFEALTATLPASGFSILDFGCGLAHLLPFLLNRHANFRYVGVDLVPQFVEENRRLFPAAEFHQLTTVTALGECFDYVVSSGTFNLLYSDSREEHEAIVRQTILELFSVTKLTLSIDFMTSLVDYMQPQAYHANPGEYLYWALNTVSRRSSVDHTYMPYEFCIKMHKERDIDSKSGLYEASVCVS
jgi:trans-aconitate methyltransferase